MLRRRLGPWYRLAVAVLEPPTRLLTRRSSTGADRVPSGGVVLVSNHISYTDPIVLAEFLLTDVRRPPRFMAKRELFVGRGLPARVMRGAGQIPVDRHTPDARKALEPALAALRQGELVVLYPEGTVTRDPDGWPMRARTGAARLGLMSGAPVVPVAQWGAQRRHMAVRPPALRRLRRRPVCFRVGPPVDLSPWRGRPLDAHVLREATEAIMDALTVELEVLRGEPAPPVRYDPRAVTGVPTDDRRTA